MTTTVDVTGTQTPAHHEPPRRNRRTGQKLAKMNWIGGGDNTASQLEGT